MTEQGAVRVSDAEREQVAARLVTAHGEGRLTLAEYDERVRAAHAAVVRDDLAPLLADLPAAPARTAGPTGPGRPSGAGRPAGAAPTGRREGPFPAPFPMPPAPFAAPCATGRGAVAAWAVASVVNVVIWLAVSVGSASVVYPWWIWVAGPWGLVLALGGLGRVAARPRA